MFIVLLKLSNNRARAGTLLPAHNAWIARGFEEGAFLLVGSLQPKLGGAVLAHGMTREDLEARVREDPFVAEDVVSAEILELTLARTDPRLAFLGA